MSSTTLPRVQLPNRQASTRSRPSVLLGKQQPMLLHMPDGVASLDAAEECLELAERYGHPRDDAQKITLQAWMGIRADGKWAAEIAAHAMSRQNGKGDEIEDRELYGLCVLGEAIVHTAHEVPTAKNAFERLEARFQAHRDLRTLVSKFRYGNGDQAIELKSGAFIAYRARTGAAGRGLDALDVVVYDEAQHLQAEHMAASSPALAVSPNAQRILAGSAGLSTSVQWWEMRLDALRDVGGSFGFVEHGAEQISLDPVTGELITVTPDPALEQTWADGNPAYGRRIFADFLATQRRLLGDAIFLREHCGVWDPLPAVVRQAAVVPPDKFSAPGVQDSTSSAVGKVALSVDVAPNSASAAVSFVGGRADGRAHLEVLESAPGVDWVVERVARALRGGQVRVVAVEPSGPVSSIVPDLRKLVDATDGVDWVQVSGREYAGACEGLRQGFIDSTVAHLGQAWLSTSIGAARRRKYGEQWVWDRDAPSDASAVISVTVAMRAWQEMPADSPEPFFFVT